MIISAKKLEEALVRPGYISKDDFSSAVKEAKKTKKDITDVLIDRELIKDEQLGRIIAEALGFPFVVLSKEKIKSNVLRIIPELVARSRNVIAFSEDENTIKIGITNPKDLEIIHNIEKKTGKHVLPYLATKRDLRKNLTRYKSKIKEEIKDIIVSLGSNISEEEKNKLNIKLVKLLLEYGYYNRASDIHVEPHESKVVVRFRIDGILHKVIEMPKNLLDYILARIKILAKMKTDEHMSAQDGKFQFRVNEENIDVRVSIIPVTKGENIVMRLLSAQQRQISLQNLGLSSDDLDKIKRAIRLPYGMILVVGPTGSGKTTTIYEILKKLNTKEVHISTIEDPVEYDIEGISQIQVNPKTNLTFAKGLRAIVRQDPDIIMVGEIRDPETANIAINSALTGHLILSTMHANNSATTFPRLLDMGIEPFLISSTINLVIAQRLVRKVCEKCRFSYTISEEELLIIKKDKNISDILKAKNKDINSLTLYKGKGCEICAGTGYSGRIGIFEVLEMTPQLKKLIINKSSSDKILKAAKREGMTTMLEDGIDKVFTGLTTLSEVLRVTKL